MGHEELVQEVAFRPHDLDPVIARLTGAQRRGHEILNLFLDPLFIQFFRGEGRNRRFNGRGRHTIWSIGIAACMQDLHRDLTVSLMDTVRHHLMVRDIVVIKQTSRPRKHAALYAGGHTTRHHKANSATGALGIELGHAVPVFGFLKPRMHRSHQHAVF